MRIRFLTEIKLVGRMIFLEIQGALGTTSSGHLTDGAEPVQRDAWCSGRVLCADAAAMGHRLWLQLVVERGRGWLLSPLSALDPQLQPQANAIKDHQHLLKAHAFPRWNFFWGCLEGGGGSECLCYYCSCLTPIHTILKPVGAT